jgi:hypothetical protein
MTHRNSSGSKVKGKEAAGGVQKRRPLEIKVLREGTAKTPFRSSPSMLPRSEYGSIHQNVSDYSDTERFARMAALMAMLRDEINDYGCAIHSELQRQIDERRYRDASDSVNNHLISFKWNTPPDSPFWTASSAGTPSSASSATKRNRFIGRELRNKEFQFLLEKDTEFHHLMSDLNGLREWWATNRAKWIKRRDRIYTICTELSMA